MVGEFACSYRRLTDTNLRKLMVWEHFLNRFLRYFGLLLTLSGVPEIFAFLDLFRPFLEENERKF